jgi:phosphate-selective porin OprO/OprP
VRSVPHLRDPFDPWNGRWGAFEVGARGSIVDIDPRLFTLGFATEKQSTRRAANWGAVMNWYFNKNFKLQADWEHTEFDNEIEFTNDDFRDHEDVILFQFQLQY